MVCSAVRVRDNKEEKQKKKKEKLQTASSEC